MKRPGTLTFVTVTIMFISLTLMIVLSANRALADNPSTCVNLYGTSIKSLKINVGARTLNPIANPNTSFAAIVGNGYTITLTLHSAGASTLGNTNVGSIWYGNTAYGFARGHCVNGVNPNSDITIILKSVFMGQATHGTIQPVEWSTGSLTESPVTYSVHWY